MTNSGTFDQGSHYMVSLLRTTAHPKAEYIPRKSLAKAFDYIRAHNTGNISLAVLAKIVGVTPHHFAASFTEATGISPHQYVLRERIEQAKGYLQDETLSVAEVGRLTGFRAQEHFTKVFRKIVGITPSTFREERSEK